LCCWNKYKLKECLSKICLVFKRENAELLAHVGSVVAVGFLVYQITLQREEFSLEHRPYLHIDFKTRIWFNESEKGFYGPGDLVIKNVGNAPANIDISKAVYVVKSDVNRNLDFMKWFEKSTGGFPHIGTVMPGQDNQSIPFHPMISEGRLPPKLIYVAALIPYTGPQKGKSYWFKYHQQFAVEIIKKVLDSKVIQGFALHPQPAYTYWDNNENSNAPQLDEVNWDKMLEREYIKDVTQRNRPATK